MSPSTQWLSLIAGAAIFLYGIKKLFEGDWIPFVLGFLIVAFSVSKIMKTRAAKGRTDDRNMES